MSKSFPGVRALDGVSFDAHEGSVHALLGENGAGKSTLLKILSGAYRPDAGTLRLGGEARVFHHTAEAISSGVAVIYQELHLAPDLSVAENVYLGHLPARLGWVDRRALLEQTLRRLETLGERIDPRTKVGRLSIGQRQLVEIAKAMTRDTRVIAFDEPTSSLSALETQRLFSVIADLKRQGRVVLYVSHRLEEVFSVCDSATVLRDGRHVETFASLAGVDAGALIQRMVGRSITDIYHYRPRPSLPPTTLGGVRGGLALEVDGLAGPGLSAPAGFQVARGEIVGFFGLVGAGRTELMKLVFGAARPRAGTVRVAGRPARIRSPRDAIRAGLVFCPEDRKKEGIVPVRSVMENINLSGRRRFSPLGFFIHEGRERKNAESQVERLGVRTPSLQQLVVYLSGGNQQKVVLGRWLGGDINAILLDEPTRGIDVGAKSEIYSIIYGLAEQGIGVVVVSSELPEVLGICDRVVVMREGAIVASLARDEATEERVLELALPVSQ